MPELPEVETVKRNLRDEVLGKKIVDIKPLYKDIIKGVSFDVFKSKVLGREILDVKRRAKNIIVKLDGDLNLLLHLKMTGHILLASNSSKISNDGRWLDAEKEELISDKQNQYIRMIFYLSDGRIMAFSDLRKFAYIKLVDGKDLENHLNMYGPEPLDKEYNWTQLASALKKKKTAIKKALLDQSVVAGVGNVYADEILWASGIHPKREANKLSDVEVKKIYKNMQLIFKKAIKAKGTSTSDFRDVDGKKGSFGQQLNVYRRTGLNCPRCGSTIKRIAINNRGTHFCPKCQVLDNG